MFFGRVKKRGKTWGSQHAATPVIPVPLSLSLLKRKGKRALSKLLTLLLFVCFFVFVFCCFLFLVCCFALFLICFLFYIFKEQQAGGAKTFPEAVPFIISISNKNKKTKTRNPSQKRGEKKEGKKNIINGRYVHFAWVFPAARRPDLKTDGFVEAKRTPRVRRVGSPPPRRPLKRKRV